MKSKGNTGRDPGGFVALPWSVLDCPAFAALSHPARALLLEFARQYARDNNGRLLASGAYLAKRGWTSTDVITRAKRELLAAGFIFETVKGHRPNKASWYAITWYVLDRHLSYDAGAVETFERGAYRKNASLTPSRGVGRPAIAPSHGVGNAPPTPSHGAISPTFDHLSTPSHGDHLEKPSAASATARKRPVLTLAAQRARQADQSPVETLSELHGRLAGAGGRLWRLPRSGAALAGRRVIDLSGAQAGASPTAGKPLGNCCATVARRQKVTA